MMYENDAYKLGMSDKFIDLMKAAYTPVVYKLLMELPSLKKQMIDFNFEYKVEQYQNYRKFFLN